MIYRSTQVSTLPAMVLASLFTALIVVGAYISIPVPGSPVPVVAQNLFVILAGMVLGWRWGVASVVVYVVLGLLGLPVFSGGRGGLAHFLGPTGGYIIGFVLSAAVAGLISQGAGAPRWLVRNRAQSETKQRSLFRDIAAAISGALVIYATGVPWLMAVTGMRWSGALTAGVLPFLPGDALKAAAAVAAIRLIEPALRTALAGRYQQKYETGPEDQPG